MAATPNLFGGFKLLEPTYALEHRRRFLRSAIPELALANSLFVPSGRWPVRGWFLLVRSDFIQINPYSLNLQLVLSDGVNPSLTFNGLTVVQARCVTRGLPTDPNSVMLVEVTDARGVLRSPWFAWPTTSQYNVRAPAYDQKFYSATMLGVNPFTYDLLAADLWNQTTLLGPYPHLPITPRDFPENWSYPGVSVWEALCMLLDEIGCFVTCDLTAAASYGVAYGGSADNAFANLTAKYNAVLHDDLEYIDPSGSGRVPGQVIVLFHRRNDQYGTEETVRRDGFQWQTMPVYSVTVASPAPYNQAVGQHYIWSDFTVRYDVDDNPLAVDTAEAALKAQDVVNQFFARTVRQTLGFMDRVYEGLLPFVTGSQVDGVAYRQAYGEGRLMWQTEVVRGLDPPFDEVKR